METALAFLKSLHFFATSVLTISTAYTLSNPSKLALKIIHFWSIEKKI